MLCWPRLVYHTIEAVEIDYEFYWFGGFVDKPTIYSLKDGVDVKDILLLTKNQIEVNYVSKIVNEIQDRINDIAFNGSLMAEIRMIYF